MSLDEAVNQRRIALLEQLRLMDPDAFAAQESGSFRTRSGAAATAGEATRRAKDQIAVLEALIAEIQSPPASPALPGLHKLR